MSQSAKTKQATQTRQPAYLLALDQGTTSSRAVIYNQAFKVIGRGQYEFPQHFPKNGWVEHDPEDLWQSTLKACHTALTTSGIQANQLAGIGITNQRETTLLWERTTGKAIHPALVWQDRRTHTLCETLKAQGHEAFVQTRTGLLLDPYFSATKLQWLLNQVPQARQRAEQGELCFGTVDSFLLFRLTGGKVHATDATNASRTSLMNLQTGQWDPELLKLFQIPATVLPQIENSSHFFGTTTADLFGCEIPIFSLIGDQQAALLGQGCIQAGQAKSTYGTGCFMLMNTGQQIIPSQNKLLTTLAWQINGQRTYALEGSIFMAGATVQWLRDKLGIIQTAAETEALAQNVPWTQSELLIPAFTGLGAPYWQAQVRAALLGMSRNTGREEIAAAALRSVVYQTQDLLQAMQQDGQAIQSLSVDGGMTENKWFLQALADLTGTTIQPLENSEATIQGAAFLAGLQAGFISELEAIEKFIQPQAGYQSLLSKAQQTQHYQAWLTAVKTLCDTTPADKYTQ